MRVGHRIIRLLQIYKGAVHHLALCSSQLQRHLEDDTVVLHTVVLPEASLRLGPSGRWVGLQSPHYHFAKKPTPRMHEGNATIVGTIRGVVFFEQWHEEHMVQYTRVPALNKCIERFR